MGCCGNKSAGPRVEYEVTTKNNGVQRVKTMTDVRLALTAGGGGSYKSVPVKPDPMAK